MLLDSLVYVVQHLLRRKLRSWLTLLGIFIGMAAVVSLISLSQGMQNAITSEFEKVGADRIVVMPGGAIAGPMSSGLSVAKLTSEDLRVIQRVRGVEFAMGMVSTYAPIYFKDEMKEGYLFGVPTDSKTNYYIERVGLFNIADGRNPKPGSKYEAVFGYRTAHKLFSRNITTKDKITIEGKEFSVVGVQSLIGTGVHDQIIRIPKDTLKELFGIGDENSMIVVKVSSGSNPINVAEDIKLQLRQFRNVKEGEEDFSVETSQEMVKVFTQILGVVQALLVGVASISLVVGAVGIMNTMYTAVVERTKEIGIMKAIGATNRAILLIFVLESGLLGLVGGAIGVILGIFISKSVELVAAQQLGSNLLKAYLSPGLILGVLFFAFSLGVLSGFFPARKAAKLQPVDALRH